jgi:sigma-B regulation protein RsbU (phosphoserine phosphatase)
VTMPNPAARYAPAAPAPNLRVLVVDDSRAQRQVLARGLERGGYTVFEAESGLDGLDICRATHVDIILSDWMMPGMNGIEFCRAYRALGLDHYGYFILLTSKADKADVAAGLDVGADDFLTKPVSPAELGARLRAGVRVLTMEHELRDKNAAITSNLAELRRLYDGISRDLDEARRFQHSLLPDRYVHFGGTDVSMVLQACGHVGGDMVGYYARERDRLGIFALDVSGHGVSSALMTARLAGCLSASHPDHSIAQRRRADGSYALKPPVQIAADLNRRMIDELETDLYLTLLLIDLHLPTGRATMVQAGHPSPLLRRFGTEAEPLGKGGLPIGLFPDATFEAEHFTFAPGDSLLIYSDGFSESHTADGAFLGEDGWARTFDRFQFQTGPELLDDLVWEVTAAAGAGEITDDLSAVLIEYGAPP